MVGKWGYCNFDHPSQRFGKTLTMKMAEQFFSIRYAGRSDLFERFTVWHEETYQKLQGTYPVIFLSFAAIKADRYEMAKKKICQYFPT